MAKDINHLGLENDVQSSDIENKSKKDPESLPNVIASKKVVTLNNKVSIDITDSPAYLISSLSDAIAVLKDLYYQGDFNGAYAAHLIAFKIAKAKKHDHNKAELKDLYLYSANVCGELKRDAEALRLYEGYHCLQMQLNSNLFKDTDPQEAIKLYQFRRFSDYSLSNLLRSEITLSRPCVMNDIVDTLIYSWLNSPSFGAKSTHKGHLDVYRRAFQDYRIASFCEDNPIKNQYAVQNTLMWAHYASEHYGFCVQYIFSADEFRKDDFHNNTASRLFRIKYRDPQKDPVDFTSEDETLFTDVAFLTKSNDWEYENEVRLIQYSPLNGCDRNQYCLSPKSSINAIYFGYRCPDANIQIIKRLLCDRNIHFYKMKIDYTNVHRLIYDEC